MTVLKSLGQNRFEGLEEVAALARSVAWGAADILRSYYRGEAHTGDLDIQEKKDGPVTAADVVANHYILDNLQASFGLQDFGYLSEETYKFQSKGVLSSPLAEPWIWIIDPLDGTRDFIDKTGEYAVQIALVYEGRPIVAAVAWPETEKVYYATKGGGTFVETRDGQVTPVQVSSRHNLEDLSIVVSRTHRDDRFNNLLQQLPCKNKKYVGSVGCKIVTIIEQQADIYISLSSKSAPKDWDMAAPELILTEAGGKFTYLDGSPLKYNRGDVNQWGCLIASNGHCHDDLCAQAKEILEKLDS
ncbi:3'(2'),5'-bisphosphate nucleotidase CysQ family protein [Argonema antarcticum]|uniref:3'(2'),5'-bisphosphate nucleotidase CysQ family protein n=1 Tax=Argonema antarcticum TaxID=2942763 RepID=UPI002011BA6C|nr:3'(2'),5'-bisphosphate nucleotidase CysQ [Argonema antarcticum A004/B2]